MVFNCCFFFPRKSGRVPPGLVIGRLESRSCRRDSGRRPPPGEPGLVSDERLRCSMRPFGTSCLTAREKDRGEVIGFAGGSSSDLIYIILERRGGGGGGGVWGGGFLGGGWGFLS